MKKNFAQKVRQNQPRLLILDWDGTCAHSWNLITDAYNAAEEKFLGKKETELTDTEDLETFFQGSYDEALKKDFSGQVGEVKEFIIQYQHENQKKEGAVLPIQGVKKLIESFQKTDGEIAFLSTQEGPLLREQFKQLGFDKLFNDNKPPIVMGTGDCFEINENGESTACNKPSGTPIRTIIDEVNTNKKPNEQITLSQTWMIGDSPETDGMAAKNAGCKAALFQSRSDVKPNQNNEASFQSEGIEHIVKYDMIFKNHDETLRFFQRGIEPAMSNTRSIAI